MTASGSGIFGSGLLTSGDLTVSGSGIFGSGLVLLDADKSNWISLNCAPVVPSNVIWTLPSGDATLSGYALISDTSGNLSWGESIPRSTFTGGIFVSGSGTFGSGIRTSGSLAVSGSGTFGSGIVFPDADASNWVAFRSASVVPSNVTWTLPSGDAAISGYALISDASGNLTWGEAGGGGATGGGTDEVFYENDQVVTANYTITTNKNAVTAGVIAINSGIDITIPSGSYWVVV
jgi:hypothetical protein